jgi:pimeloyl-ACP methyl ester carboxylesterase
VKQLPIIYIRGYAGTTSGIDTQVDDPFYGFNRGATHVRVGGDGDPHFYQFEGPMLRLMIDERYELHVHGDQHAFLEKADDSSIAPQTLWVYRFYDQAATTFVPQPHQNVLEQAFSMLHRRVTTTGFDIEQAAAGLYDLIELVLAKTADAHQVFLVAHSMGGLVARSMLQKVCGQSGRRSATELVDKLFTYGTPHGGIAFRSGALGGIEEAFGPAGSDIFAPEKMYGYLTPGATFGDEPGDKGWDPQDLAGALDVDDVFCLIGTDPKDYGPTKVAVGPKSDGLVRIEHAYVRRAHRAFVFKSHSGSYGEVNSEEGYQNLRRFLFGRWKVQIDLQGLPDLATLEPEVSAWSWQADLRLAVRGLPIVLSEQQAAHYCPIQLNDELTRGRDKLPDLDSPDRPVPFVTTFLLDPLHIAGAAAPADRAALPHGGRARHSLTLRIGHLVEQGGSFDMSEHLEQTWDWADTLFVDLGPNDVGTGLQAWMAWRTQLSGSQESFDPVTDGLPPTSPSPMTITSTAAPLRCRVDLPAAARTLAVLGEQSHLSMTITDREAGTG